MVNRFSSSLMPPFIVLHRGRWHFISCSMHETATKLF
jgi:hypothetical protein